MKVLLIGGSGTFGRRIAQLLAETGGFDILIAGRDLARADAAAGALRPPARAVSFDRNGDVEARIAALKPDLVIDAAGPFQDAAGDPYRVARACIAARSHYLDIADARDFVGGIETLSAAAGAAGVSVISGASSVPALSSAYVAELARGMSEIAAIDIALSASNRATAGANVNAVILSYVGRTVCYRRAGGWVSGHGWGEMVARDFVVTGRAPIRRRLVALCDVPDLDLLPRLHPGARNVIFRAGAELALQNRALATLGWLVRHGWLHNLQRWAPFLTRWQHRLGFLGSDRSGMRVDILGRDDTGKGVVRRWTLLAEDGHGPWVPSFAAVLLARKLARGDLIPGAMSAANLLTPTDFRTLFERFHLFEEATREAAPLTLYARTMGPDFDRLPSAVRALHNFLAPDRAAGRASVTRGNSLLARLAAKLGGFPAAVADTPVAVDFDVTPAGETWTRDFGGEVFRSHLSLRQRGN
ncbi:MAG: saccharopine dehydrogenase NADP-binding domain-containing protein, partial [Rhodospirillaceae bacterium]|nr:saccharopine dehydrogenase NADP-binding domain-containing protein [Rhodospirillaceae bacterium]